MEELRELLEELIGETLLSMVFSGVKHPVAAQKIRVRPVRIKGQVLYQAAAWDGKKEKHRNLTASELKEEALSWMKQDYKQLQADTTGVSASVLVSKKGKVTVKKRVLAVQRPAQELSHNRKKRYILEEGRPVSFLVELGVMTSEGKVINGKHDKFRQINRFLEFIEDICPCLPRDRELRMIDFGCGKSYLTFAMYYYFHEIQNLDVRIIGLDLKEDVIQHCSSLAEKFGYKKLQFFTGDIADYEGVSQVDLVVTLHACDTATDYALAKAVAWNASAILSVPCCQHELNGQIQNELLQPVLQYGLLKERMAALITDGLRASLLEQQGYEVQVLEFIDMEHTPKNILIRAVKHSEKPKKISLKKNGKAEMGESLERKRERLDECMEFLQVKPTLEKLLRQETTAVGRLSKR